MRQLCQTRQVEEAARAFDRVRGAEDRVEHLRIVWILLEAHEARVQLVKLLARLDQEFR